MKTSVWKLWVLSFILIISLVCLVRVCLISYEVLRLSSNPSFAICGHFLNPFDALYFLGLLPICFLGVKTICCFIKKANSLYATEKEVRNVQKTTVAGVLDEKTKKAIDKDGDGKIMVSEYYPLSEEEVLNKIIKVDDNFSKEDFYAWVKHLYSTILDAYNQMEPIRLRRFESDYLYQRHIALFKDKASREEVISHYYIKGVLLKDFKIEGDKEIIIVALTASLKRNKLASKNDSCSYILTFSRNKGLKTKGCLLDDTGVNCPNCGAVLSIDNYGICSYCQTVIPSGKYGWVLIDMKSIQLVGE